MLLYSGWRIYVIDRSHGIVRISSAYVSLRRIIVPKDSTQRHIKHRLWYMVSLGVIRTRFLPTLQVWTIYHNRPVRTTVLQNLLTKTLLLA